MSGTEVPLKFKVDAGLSGLDIATKNNPYSRQIDCTTRATVTPGQVAITPRPVPVAAVTTAGKTLSVDASGTYTYPWQTTTAWGDTCREFVFTTKTGVQHRSYFKFLAATHVDAPRRRHRGRDPRPDAGHERVVRAVRPGRHAGVHGGHDRERDQHGG